MSTTGELTPTSLLAAASGTLLSGGYQQVSIARPEWDTVSSRLFEDEYNIVGVAVFETCEELLTTWPRLQGSLVDTISKYLAKGESKSWDGYLVLLSPGIGPSSADEIESIRYNTTRLRKLVATGEELRTISDVERVLRPLLPIGEEQVRLATTSVLEILPKLLKSQDVPEETTRLVVEAFESQAPILERLHENKGGA
jgi:hypothetical protein